MRSPRVGNIKRSCKASRYLHVTSALQVRPHKEAVRRPRCLVTPWFRGVFYEQAHRAHVNSQWQGPALAPIADVLIMWVRSDRPGRHGTLTTSTVCRRQNADVKVSCLHVACSRKSDGSGRSCQHVAGVIPCSDLPEECTPSPFLADNHTPF
jgi:hypothetical protein